MSWLGYKGAKLSEAESREANRKKLEADRLLRKQQREERQKRLEAVAKAQEETTQALREFD